MMRAVRYANKNGKPGRWVLSESYPASIYNKNVLRSYNTIAALKTSSQIKSKFKRFYNQVYTQLGILLLAYSGQRDYAEQWNLRQKYLAGGNRASSPGWSWHPYGRAIDVVPISEDGSLVWNTRDWSKIRNIAFANGLESGHTFGDPGHFTYKTGTTLALQRGFNPGWEYYKILEDNMGVLKPKNVEGKVFPVGAVLLTTAIATGLFFGGRYLYQRYA